jgi:hypothetical protein
MYGKRARALRQCQALTINGFGPQCRNFSKVGFNLCSIHLTADHRIHPSEGERAFNKLLGIKRHKSQYLRCHCLAYPFVHPAGGGICCWPFRPTQRLECKPNKEAIALRAKLRRKGIVVNTIKELMERGIGEDSRLIDLDFDPNDLSMEEEYLAKIQYEPDVLALPIEERRRIEEQRLIAEFMIKIGKADIDGAGSTIHNGSNDDYYVAVASDDNGNLIEEDRDLIEIDGEVYKIN